MQKGDKVIGSISGTVIAVDDAIVFIQTNNGIHAVNVGDVTAGSCETKMDIIGDIRDCAIAMTSLIDDFAESAELLDDMTDARDALQKMITTYNAMRAMLDENPRWG